MKKKRNLIGVCLVAVLMLALTVIGYAAGDGEAAPEYGAWCLVPPLVTIADHHLHVHRHLGRCHHHPSL